MARTHSLAWSQLKIGILAVAALGLATLLIVAVGGQGGFAWERYALKTNFTDIAGLKTGAVVRVAGVDVGKVTDIQFVGTNVEVVFEVNESMQERITEHSRASIGALSLLGEPLIAISPSGEGRPLKDGDFIGHRRYGRAGRRRRRRSDEVDPGHPRRQGHRRQVDDRRRGVP